MIVFLQRLGKSSEKKKVHLIVKFNYKSEEHNSTQG